ncbi:unnamed protein product, partial [Ectocarpus sp. 4 AP-2014]
IFSADAHAISATEREVRYPAALMTAGDEPDEMYEVHVIASAMRPPAAPAPTKARSDATWARAPSGSPGIAPGLKMCPPTRSNDSPGSSPLSAMAAYHTSTTSRLKRLK